MKPNKLPKNTLPQGHTVNDFKCSGPVATKDGEFKDTRIADLMCFDQDDGNDKNKFYHGCICESKLDGGTYLYFQWGRLGVTSDFQFYKCDTVEQASIEYCKQLHSKNDKRGTWEDGPLGKPILKAKAGKSLYLVRPQTSRKCGLPDAASISNGEKISTKNVNTSLDQESAKLIADLDLGATEYTRSNMVDSSIPTQEAIDEARDILDELTRQLNKDTYDERLVKLLYSRIPKKIQRHQKIIATHNLVADWNKDLDAYEAAISSLGTTSVNYDLPFKIRWLNPNEELGRWIYTHFSCSTLNRHSYINRQLKAVNIWEIERPKDKFDNELRRIRKIDSEKPINQPEKRLDISPAYDKLYQDSGTFLLFHGLRSVNVKGVLSKGFLLPKQLAHGAVNGSVFGAGTYWADDTKKSYGYTSAKNSIWNHGSGGLNSRNPFMFISDVTLGTSYIPQNSCSTLPDKYNSVFAKGGQTLKQGGYLENNEFVVFNTDQINIRYLVEFQ